MITGVAQSSLVFRAPLIQQDRDGDSNEDMGVNISERREAIRRQRIKAEQASTTKFSMNLEIVVPVTLILLQGSQNLHSPARTTVVMTLINAIKLGHRT
jgi:hypothetical protein